MEKREKEGEKEREKEIGKKKKGGKKGEKKERKENSRETAICVDRLILILKSEKASTSLQRRRWNVGVEDKKRSRGWRKTKRRSVASRATGIHYYLTQHEQLREDRGL